MGEVCWNLIPLYLSPKATRHSSGQLLALQMIVRKAESLVHTRLHTYTYSQSASAPVTYKLLHTHNHMGPKMGNINTDSY